MPSPPRSRRRSRRGRGGGGGGGAWLRRWARRGGWRPGGGGGVMMARAQGELEDWLNEAGRELKRQLMQDHLDARARTETRIPALTGADQIERRRAERGHCRGLATTVGTVEIERLA